MKRLLFLLAACSLFSFCPLRLWADDELKIEPNLHKWGLELDLDWSPFALLPGRQTTLWAGLEGDYSSWNYFHDPVSGDALSSADLGSASVTETRGLWFLGVSQGLVPQADALGPGSRPWADRDLLEAFAYYRGVDYDVLSSGSYLSDSGAPDKNGYLETSFLAGLSLDRTTQFDAHDLKQGYLLEVSTAYAPRSLQSVDVDFERLTAVLQGFIPLWDMKPESRLNELSLLGAVNLAADRLWGDSIPSEERQVIGGRAWNGVGGWESGVGGAVRGIEDGFFDGTGKAVANAELRLNLPSFELRDPFDLPLIDRTVVLVPGLLAFVDGGLYDGLLGQDTGAVLSAGFGAYLTVMKYGTLAVYNNYWLVGASSHKSVAVPWTIELGMHF